MEGFRAFFVSRFNALRAGYPGFSDEELKERCAREWAQTQQARQMVAHTADELFLQHTATLNAHQYNANTPTPLVRRRRAATPSNFHGKRKSRRRPRSAPRRARSRPVAERLSSRAAARASEMRTTRRPQSARERPRPTKGRFHVSPPPTSSPGRNSNRNDGDGGDGDGDEERYRALYAGVGVDDAGSEPDAASTLRARSAGRSRPSTAGRSRPSTANSNASSTYSRSPSPSTPLPPPSSSSRPQSSALRGGGHSAARSLGAGDGGGGGEDSWAMSPVEINESMSSRTRDRPWSAHSARSDNSDRYLNVGPRRRKIPPRNQDKLWAGDMFDVSRGLAGRRPKSAHGGGAHRLLGRISTRLLKQRPMSAQQGGSSATAAAVLTRERDFRRPWSAKKLLRKPSGAILDGGHTKKTEVEKARARDEAEDEAEAKRVGRGEGCGEGDAERNAKRAIRRDAEEAKSRHESEQRQLLRNLTETQERNWTRKRATRITELEKSLTVPPRWKRTECHQCYSAATCFQDASEAFDADGDGIVDDDEGGGFYCELCWTGVYGKPPNEGGDCVAEPKKIIPVCKLSSCDQCHTSTTCFQDNSEAYDVDGDGKLDEAERGGFYCELCWVKVYGAAPEKAPPRWRTTACHQCHASKTCYQDASEAFDVDGDGTFDDHETGGFYCGTCWVSTYGNQPELGGDCAAPPKQANTLECEGGGGKHTGDNVLLPAMHPLSGNFIDQHESVLSACGGHPRARAGRRRPRPEARKTSPRASADDALKEYEAAAALKRHLTKQKEIVTKWKMLREERAASCIQFRFRLRAVVAARKEIHALQLERESEENGAAVACQAIFRREVGKKKMQQAREVKKLEVEAHATNIQAHFRGQMGRKRMSDARVLLGEEQRILAESVKNNTFRELQARTKLRNRGLDSGLTTEEAAAVMVQCVWRIKTANRAAAQLREKRIAMQEEAAAIIVQSAFRSRKAWANLQELRKARIALQEEGAAICLQCAYKIRKARTELMGRYDNVLQALEVIVVRGEGLRVADKKTSDPRAMIHFDTDGGTADDSLFAGCGTSVKKSTLNPVWNESLLFPGVKSSMIMRVTLADWDLFSKHDFLGQTPGIRVPLFTSKDPVGTQVEVQNVVLGPIRSDPKGLGSMADKQVEARGDVSIIFVKAAHMVDTYVGYVEVVESKLIGTKVVQKWCMIANSVLRVYKDRNTIKPSKVLELHTIKGFVSQPQQQDKKSGRAHFPFELDVGELRKLQACSSITVHGLRCLAW